MGTKQPSSAAVEAAEKEIKAILFSAPDHDIAAWALARLGLPAEWRDVNVPGNYERCARAVRDAVTVSRADIDAYLERAGILPETWLATVPDTVDNLYFVREGDGWVFYWQERGARASIPVEFIDLHEARKLMINLRIGPWLKHLHVGCASAAGIVTEL